MPTFSRRELIRAAAALGVAAAWGGAASARPGKAWTERRDLFPEGVASGDPGPDSVLLWTRRPAADGAAVPLIVEVAEDEAFSRVVATGEALAAPQHDWTVRVLVGGLKPRREYWYRFVDGAGAGSRVGRTITAPADDDARPVSFAFVSCQNVNTDPQNSWRRMIHEDQRAAPDDRLGFVLHLGDFIYELVWYPEDRKRGYYDRKIRDILRYPTGRKVSDFHIPADLADYRTVYRAYLADPDIQDARARFPIVAIWDNHEFSWQAWQSIQVFGGEAEPGQVLKVAANQAWWEYQPARVANPGGSLARFKAPVVKDVPVEQFDADGLGTEPNNLAAINSLIAYRAFRYGKHLELIVTDERSFRSEDLTNRPEVGPLAPEGFPSMFPEEVMEVVEAGRAYGGGNPPATIGHGASAIPNFAAKAPPWTILGAKQKAWFLDRLARSQATWKVWGSSQGTLDYRADPQNLPAGLTNPWPWPGYACFGGGDHGAAYVERGEIYDFVASRKITGLATVCGDRHSFWAGVSAKTLPPKAFEPVGVAFVTGSLSSAGMVESMEHNFPKDHPLRPLFLADRAGKKPEPAVNMLLRHGVRSCLEYAKSADAAKARAVSNPDNAPHLDFVDMGGHGYAVVRLSGQAIETEFVCLPRPIERAQTPDGGPLRYRVSHRAELWRPGERPRLRQRVLEGDPGISAI